MFAGGNLNSYATGDANSSTAIGFGVIASLAPSSLKFLSKSFITKFIGKGKVSFLKGKTPLPKEIDAAEFLAAKTGVKIYIRGGKSTQGADFFLNGKRWELKTLKEATSSAVNGSIRKGVGQSSRIIIDGRKSGLTKKIFLDGLAWMVWPEHREMAITGNNWGQNNWNNWGQIQIKYCSFSYSRSPAFFS